MQIITSKDNDFIKSVKKLKDKKYRDEQGVFIVEGIKIVDEAIKENAKIKNIVICSDYIESFSRDFMEKLKNFECTYVNEKVFKIVSDVKNPQGVLAIIEKKNSSNINYNEDIIVILDGIQDPGNLGTIIRTVDSIGVSQIIVSKETADAYNSKVIRSTMGAIYRVNIVEVDNLISTIKQVKENKFEVVATSLDTQNCIYDINFNKKAIVIGNEANGVSKDIMDEADIRVKIPMLGKTESLNAAVATGIVLYEYVRNKINRKEVTMSVERVYEIIKSKIYNIIKEALASRFRADIRYNEVKDLDLQQVKKLKGEYGIGGIILDVDETIRKDFKKVPTCNEEWLKFLRQEFKVCLVSNGLDGKIEELAEKIDMDYISLANKPLRKSFIEAANKMGLDPENILVIGDNIIDDVYGGKRCNMRTASVVNVIEERED